MNYEIERKFLVKLPDTEYILKNFNAEASKITQTYLDLSDKDTNARVRKREFSSKTEYTYTEKKRISDIKRIENEKVISEDEYLDLLKKADRGLNTISKTRIALSYGEHIFELDIFDFWDDVAFLEVELKEENEKISFPPFINILAEVSDKKEFTNHALAKRIPDLTKLSK